MKEVIGIFQHKVNTTVNETVQSSLDWQQRLPQSWLEKGLIVTGSLVTRDTRRGGIGPFYCIIRTVPTRLYPESNLETSRSQLDQEATDCVQRWTITSPAPSSNLSVCHITTPIISWHSREPRLWASRVLLTNLPRCQRRNECRIQSLLKYWRQSPTFQRPFTLGSPWRLCGWLWQLDRIWPDDF